MTRLPVFNLGEFENSTGASREKYCTDLDRFCSKIGFLLVENHGSPHMSKLADLKRQLELLKDATGQVDLVIGHNDLLAANILDDGDQLWLIDWEYGGFNTPLFDLAGLAGNNGLSILQEQQMLEQYFDRSWEIYWRPYQAMKCISLMRETLWSMVSEIYSEIEFDYGAYTSENLCRLNSAILEFQQI